MRGITGAVQPGDLTGSPIGVVLEFADFWRLTHLIYILINNTTEFDIAFLVTAYYFSIVNTNGKQHSSILARDIPVVLHESFHKGGLVGPGFNCGVNLFGEDGNFGIVVHDQTVGFLHGMEQLVALHTSLQGVNQEYVLVIGFGGGGEIKFFHLVRSFVRILDLSGDPSGL